MVKRIRLFAFTAPALFFVILFIFIPFIMTISYSFTDWNGLRVPNLVGFDNFIRFFGDSGALNSLTFTLKYAGAYVVIINILAILLASVLSGNIPGKGFFRTSFYLPYVIALVIIGFVWQFIFSRVFDSFYISTGETIAFLQWSWLGELHLAFYSVLIVNVWQSLGFFTIIYVAAFQSVPEDVIEAAAIDGAGNLKRFFTVKLPLIMPSITFCTFLAIANTFKQFDLIFSLTEGGPGSATRTMALDIYRTGFGTMRQVGYASAKSVILFVLVAIITVLQLTVFRRREVDL